jgi:hypothetical protein
LLAGIVTVVSGRNLESFYHFKLIFVLIFYGCMTLIVGGTATPVALNTLPLVPWHSALTASVVPFSSRITS